MPRHPGKSRGKSKSRGKAPRVDEVSRGILPGEPPPSGFPGGSQRPLPGGRRLPPDAPQARREFRPALPAPAQRPQLERPVVSRRGLDRRGLGARGIGAQGRPSFGAQPFRFPGGDQAFFRTPFGGGQGFQQQSILRGPDGQLFCPSCGQSVGVSHLR